jgi:gluconolactonase
MGNGGINYPTAGNPHSLLICDQGSLTSPSALTILDPTRPYKTTPLVTSFHHRPFTSLNDVIIHSNGSLWFTDPIYGHEQGFRPKPEVPSQVWRLDVESGQLRPVADGFGRCNGLCFSPGEETLYVTDTDWIHGDGGTDLHRASSM